MATCNCTGACRMYGTCSGLDPRAIGCMALTETLAFLRGDDPAYERRTGERRQINVAGSSWFDPLPRDAKLRRRIRQTDRRQDDR